MDYPKSSHDLANQIKKNDFVFEDVVKGIDMESDIDLDTFLNFFKTMGIQASHIYKGIQEIQKMRSANAKIFLGCTSNIITSGCREIIKYLAKNKYIDVFIVTAGGIEEDLIKCMKPTRLAAFDLNGKDLRDQGWNRVGNMVLNNENYFDFEVFMTEFFAEIVEGKEINTSLNKSMNYISLVDDYKNIKKVTESNDNTPITVVSPSEMIKLLGKKINNPDSILYWCYKNNIPVYSPALTDGSLGDMMTFYSKKEYLIVDICSDIKKLNFESIVSRETGAIILGGGLIKHMILNANLFRNGLEYCVIITTAIEHDASDAGASLTEAYSWGKIKPDRTCIKIYGEASTCFPLLVYGGFKSTKVFK